MANIGFLLYFKRYIIARITSNNEFFNSTTTPDEFSEYLFSRIEPVINEVKTIIVFHIGNVIFNFSIKRNEMKFRIQNKQILFVYERDIQYIFNFRR